MHNPARLWPVQHASESLMEVSSANRMRMLTNANQPFNQACCANQAANQAVNQAVNQPVNQPTHQAVNQPALLHKRAGTVKFRVLNHSLARVSCRVYVGV